MPHIAPHNFFGKHSRVNFSSKFLVDRNEFVSIHRVLLFIEGLPVRCHVAALELK